MTDGGRQLQRPVGQSQVGPSGRLAIQQRMVDSMSALTYIAPRSPTDKPLVWLHGEVKTPPLTAAARIEVGFLLRRLQRGENLSLPASRPMPSVGKRCHELRVNDQASTWRILYRVDEAAIVIVDVFSKKTTATPKQVIDAAQVRLSRYDAATKEDDDGEDEES